MAPTFVSLLSPFLLCDVMALAFWTNSTRAATLMWGDGSHGRNMSFIEGVSGGHHSISHHGGRSESLEMFTLINTFYVEQFAYFLGSDPKITSP